MDELQLLTSSIADLNWFKENSAFIGDRYEGEFIAIDNKKILESAPKMDILIRKLEKRGVNINLVLIKHVNPQGEIIIL